MIIKKLVQVEDPLLHQKTKTVKNMKDPKVQLTIRDLIDSLHYHNLIGIAAPQIGSDLRIFVTEVRKTKYRNPKDLDILRIFINPEIIWTSKKQIEIWEACGSVQKPKLIWAPVTRPVSIKVTAQNKKGKE